jgi:hypothetical protein
MDRKELERIYKEKIAENYKIMGGYKAELEAAAYIKRLLDAERVENQGNKLSCHILGR